MKLWIGDVYGNDWGTYYGWWNISGIVGNSEDRFQQIIKTIKHMDDIKHPHAKKL